MFVDLTWESITGCFTPTLLFLLLNLMIATIALISNLNTQNKPNQPTTATSPSPHRQEIRDSVPNLNTQSHDLSRDVSESFQVHQSQAAYLFDETPEQTETLFFSEPKESSSDDSRDEQLSMDEIYSKLTTSSHFSRPSGDIPARMGKSASLKSALGHFDEEEIVEARRPATVRERGEAKVTEGDAEVDAKADDFINRFREQLKLQRVESVIKYKNIIMSGEVNIN